MGSFFPMATRRMRICSSKVKVVVEATKPRPRYVQCSLSFTRQCPTRWRLLWLVAYSKLGNVLHKKLLGISIHRPRGILLLLFCLCLLSLSFFQSILSPSHIHYYQFTFVPVIIFKGGKAKVDYGQLFPHGNKDDEDLQLEGQGGCGSNQTKTKVHECFSCSTPPCPTQRRSWRLLWLVAKSKLGDILNKKLLGISICRP